MGLETYTDKIDLWAGELKFCESAVQMLSMPQVTANRQYTKLRGLAKMNLLLNKR